MSTSVQALGLARRHPATDDGGLAKSVGFRVSWASARRSNESRQAVAQKTIVIVEDDLGGGAADESVTFALDGVTYEIDLSEANARSLRDALGPYVAAGRRVGGARRVGGSASARTDKEQLDAMRRWARENGYEVSSRGRISKVVRDAYNASR